jgi:DNA primase
VRVAGVARELLEELGLRGYPKTSGNRGVHVYVRIEPRWEFVDVRHAAIGFGRELERRDDGVTTAWWKEERGERIFVDYNQNCRDRTIASAYSLRPIPGAPVSTPMTWEELAGVTDPAGFNLFTVPDRLADGDPWAGIDDEHHSIQPLLDLYEASDLGEMPYPPDYPKMPGEPPRVQPSRINPANWPKDDDA